MLSSCGNFSCSSHTDKFGTAIFHPIVIHNYSRTQGTYGVYERHVLQPLPQWLLRKNWDPDAEHQTACLGKNGFKNEKGKHKLFKVTNLINHTGKHKKTNHSLPKYQTRHKDTDNI